MDKKAERAFRMDIRFAGLQRAKYEKAAALKGQTLTQWVSSHLDACASCDIAEVTLSDEAFDRFCIILDAPMPAATRELLERKPIWPRGCDNEAKRVI